MASQINRVLARLRLGPVSPVDFQLPHVCDGGKPILRVAARVLDLQANGCVISSQRAENGTAIYRLVSEPDPQAVTNSCREASAMPDGALFDDSEFAASGDWRDAA